MEEEEEEVEKEDGEEGDEDEQSECEDPGTAVHCTDPDLQLGQDPANSAIQNKI